MFSRHSNHIGLILKSVRATLRSRVSRHNSFSHEAEAEQGHDHERGAVLVEAAFITMMLLSLLVGTVTAGVAFSQKTSLQTAAREATRFGATLPVNGDMTAWLNRVLEVAKSAGGNDLAATIPGQQICIAYVYPKGSAASDRNTRIIQSGGTTGSPTSGAGAVCFDDGRPDDERRVQVVTNRTSTIQAAVFSVDVDLSSTSSARFERTS
jgi:Flp pilus assembly protein TadG